MNQKEATVKAILDTLSARDIEYEMGGDVRVSEVLNDVDKKEIRAILFSGFRSGDISFKPEFQWKVDSDVELNKYISGLLNNWVRKFKDFNCGEVYVAKNPGSRAHSSDEPMRELKKLMTQVAIEGDPEAIAEVKEAIELRKTQIKPKSAIKPINVDALPENLRHLVQTQD